MKRLSNFIQENLTDNTQPIIETQTESLIIAETETTIDEKAPESILDIARIAPEKEERTES